MRNGLMTMRKHIPTTFEIVRNPVPAAVERTGP